MNTPFFSFFLLITLGFSIFSVVGTPSATWNTPDNTQFAITLDEDLALSVDLAKTQATITVSC